MRGMVVENSANGRRTTKGTESVQTIEISYLGDASRRGGPPTDAEGAAFSTGYGCTHAASCAYRGREARAMPPMTPLTDGRWRQAILAVGATNDYQRPIWRPIGHYTAGSGS